MRVRRTAFVDWKRGPLCYADYPELAVSVYVCVYLCAATVRPQMCRVFSSAQFIVICCRCEALLQ